MKKKAGLMIIIFIIITIFIYLFLGESIRYYKIQSDISKINNDSLSKYYQIFLVENDIEIYNEMDFNKFLEDKNLNLKTQLLKYRIKLNSEYKSNQKNVFKGFYHIGPDKIDNQMESLIIEYNINSLNGDIMIPTNNYFGINFYSIYGVENNEIKNLGVFDPISIVRESISCVNNVRMKIDTIVFDGNRITYHNKKVKVMNKIDDETLNILLNDSLLKTLVKEYNDLYITFKTYRPKYYFYCDEGNEK